MTNVKQREAEAESYYQRCLDNLDPSVTPEGQKFPSGTRVRIAKDLGVAMSHFVADADATVEYTYSQMYGGSNVKSYCLNIDGIGKCAWYEEHQLTLIEE